MNQRKKEAQTKQDKFWLSSVFVLFVLAFSFLECVWVFVHLVLVTGMFRGTVLGHLDLAEHLS